MLYSPTVIANMALAELPSEPIASLDERSLAARECGRWYGIVVAELLAMHAWSWAVQRAYLAPLLDDRTAEWAYAYALPSASVYPLRIVPNINNPGVGYVPLTGQLMAVPFNPWAVDPLTIPFVIAGTTLYTNDPSGLLEYTTDAGMEPLFTPLFARALALELAARICSAITKSREKQGDLVKLAEAERGRAIASDLNQTPKQYGRFIDEAAIARGAGWQGTVWPYGSHTVYLPS